MGAYLAAMAGGAALTRCLLIEVQAVSPRALRPRRDVLDRYVVPRLDSDVVACRVVDIVVAAAARRSGIGSELIRAAETEAGRHGCRRLDLSSGDWRSDAHAFYEALGFEQSALAFRKRLQQA